MSYHRFAYVYDFLMKDMPYDSWLQMVQDYRKACGIQGKKILDLGCGTGELTVGLAELGYEVTGVDLSEEMLMMAREKADNSGVNIQLFQQDMSKIEGLGTFDIITIFCDSLCYVTDEEDIKNTFLRANEHLKPGGLLLFDVHSIYKMSQIFMNQTFSLNEEEVAYIWSCFPGEEPNSVEHDLTFFVKENDTDLYSRFDEFHTQRTYPVYQLENWLREAGFSVKEILGDFSRSEYTDASERIFFINQKDN